MGVKRFQYNDDYFKVIDTEEKAYWLGFIFADGHNGTKGFELSLKESDVGHLEKFRTAIEGNMPIHYRERQKAYRIGVTSYEFRRNLENNGVTSNKSETAEFPSLDSKLIRHFVRGYFDGDGSVGVYYHKPSNKNVLVVTLVGTEMMLNGILSHIGIQTVLHSDPRWKSTITRHLRLTGDKAKMFLMWLYLEEHVSLERKVQLANAVLFGNEWEYDCGIKRESPPSP